MIRLSIVHVLHRRPLNGPIVLAVAMLTFWLSIAFFACTFGASLVTAWSLLVRQGVQSRAVQVAVSTGFSTCLMLLQLILCEILHFSNSAARRMVWSASLYGLLLLLLLALPFLQVYIFLCRSSTLLSSCSLPRIRSRHFPARLSALFLGIHEAGRLFALL